MPAPNAPPSPAGSLAALHAAVALFGFAGLFGKWIAWEPPAIVLGRTLVAAAVLAVVVRRRTGAHTGIPSRCALRCSPSGRPFGLTWPGAGIVANGVILAVHWVAFFAAIQVSTVAIGLLGFASFPLFTVLLERALLGVPLSRMALARVALVSAGLALLVPEFSWASVAVRGLAWGVLSGFTFALLTVRTRRLRSRSEADRIALWQNAVAALVVAPLVLARGALPGTLEPQALLLVAVLGVFCTAGAHTLFIASLARVPATTAAVVAALEPVYGIALAWWLLGEVPGPRTLAGAALLVAAAAMATRRPDARVA